MHKSKKTQIRKNQQSKRLKRYRASDRVSSLALVVKTIWSASVKILQPHCVQREERTILLLSAETLWTKHLACPRQRLTRLVARSAPFRHRTYTHKQSCRWETWMDLKQTHPLSTAESRRPSVTLAQCQMKFSLKRLKKWSSSFPISKLLLSCFKKTTWRLCSVWSEWGGCFPSKMTLHSNNLLMSIWSRNSSNSCKEMTSPSYN